MSMTEGALPRLEEIMERVEEAAWKFVTCTDPCDRKAAENAVRLIYSERGADLPKRFIWCNSPNEAAEHLKSVAEFGESQINNLWLYPRSIAAQKLRLIPEDNEVQGPYSFYRQGIYRSKSGLLRENLRSFAPIVAFGYGCQDAPWLLTFSHFRSELQISALPELKGLNALLRTGGWFAPFSKACIMIERPKAIHTDSEGLLHLEGGPALSWRCGLPLYFWHGIEVPSKAILFPDALNHQDICTCANIEVRRALLEIYGLERFISETNTKIIHEDETGQLLKLDLPRNFKWSADPLIVRVLNSTPEPDGSFNTYLLSVPPNVGTAKEGVAWTFGMEPLEYDPLIQT